MFESNSARNTITGLYTYGLKIEPNSQLKIRMFWRSLTMLRSGPSDRIARNVEPMKTAKLIAQATTLLYIAKGHAYHSTRYDSQQSLPICNIYISFTLFRSFNLSLF